MIGNRVCVGLGVLACVLADTFDSFDLNHDGTLSRPEFETFELSMHGVVNTTFSFSSKTAALEHVLGFWPAFVNSLMMIWATEIGDKTFFIAAILAMSNPRMVVFSAAISALAIMTVLSAGMGYALVSDNSTTASLNIDIDCLLHSQTSFLESTPTLCRHCSSSTLASSFCTILVRWNQGHLLMN
jgi:hypothetical protein